MDLIKINTDQKGIKTVNARELWRYLESKQDFSTWVKSRIEQYGFIENADFVTLHKKRERQILIEYYVTLDMAKELSMIEKTAKGKAARVYFIEAEKIALSRTYTRLELIEMARTSELGRLAEKKINGKLSQKIKEDRPKVAFAESIRHTEASVTIDQFAKMLCKEGFKIGRNRLYKSLRDFKMLMANNIPYQLYIEKGYFTLDEYVYVREDKREYIAVKTMMTGVGQTVVWKKLTEGQRP